MALNLYAEFSFENLQIEFKRWTEKKQLLVSLFFKFMI